MAVNVVGLVAVIVFYVLILVIGIIAARKSRSTEKHPDHVDIMLAGRNIGLLVGIFTMTATWVGGGYINGTAEVVFTDGYGAVWAQAPLGYSLSLVVGGLLFAKKMRSAGYVTMLDPFQQKFGERMGGLLFIPALFGELFWTGAILNALGATLAVIVDLDFTIAVIISAAIAVVYTLFGGLYSVAYTDVAQLACIFIGLVLSLPFAMLNENVKPILETSSDWIGTLKIDSVGKYADSLLMLIFGGIPWQVYFQRVLSSRTAKGAQQLSFAAAFGCLVMAVPPILIGAVAKSTDWNATDYRGPLPPRANLVLPLVLQHVCPTAVAFVGLGAVSAAVMSSADSSVLSASSMFARNVYKLVFRQKASEREVVWVMRGGVFVIGGIACVMGIMVTSIYELWFLCSDLVYVILFPQLVSVVYIPWVNTYGSLTAYVVGIVLRLLAGEKILALPPLIKFPWFDESNSSQLFPFRTFCMCCSFCTLVAVSFLTTALFEKGIVAANRDVFKCINRRLASADEVSQQAKQARSTSDTITIDGKQQKSTSEMGTAEEQAKFLEEAAAVNSK